MHTRRSFLAGAASVASAAHAQDPRFSVLILTGESDHPHHDWRATTPLLKDLLEKTGRVDVKVTEQPLRVTAQSLAGYDALVVNYNGPRWGEQVERAVEEFVRSGRGLVAFHLSSYGAFFGLTSRGGRFERSGGGWPAWPEMVGVTWKPENIGHARRHVFRVKWVEREHPIARGLEESFLANDELYHRMDLHPEARVLATAFSEPPQGGTGRDEPMLWTVAFGKGRVAFTPLGHDTAAMSQPGFATLFARATEWAAGRLR